MSATTRVTSTGGARLMLANLQSNYTSLVDLQDHISSGKELRRPSDSPSATLSMFANLTRTHTRVKDPSNADHNGTEIPFAPSELANAGLSLHFPGNIHAEAYYHWVGRYYDSTSRGSRQAFGHFGLINARIYTDLIQNARQEVRLTLDLNNLTDRQYRMPFDFRDPGFNAFVGVDVRY